MWSVRSTRQIALAAGVAALIGMGGLSACSTTKEKPAETKAPTETSAPGTQNSPQPTEKAPRIEPGGNSFSPSVKAPSAPTALPGNVITGG